MIFILTNLFFHVLYNRNSITLLEASHTIGLNTSTNSIITGLNAHQLSIENFFIPIWWLDTKIHKTYPNWNSNFQFFRKNMTTAISYDFQGNQLNGYFKCDSIPNNFILFRTDTIFLYPKIDNSGYLDSNIIKFYKFTK
jgi:hypothetical protein